MSAILLIILVLLLLGSGWGVRNWKTNGSVDPLTTILVILLLVWLFQHLGYIRV